MANHGLATPSPLTLHSVATVSVIIPNYNYANYLPYCLASVLDQADVDLRVLVIDNCSTDDSLDVLKEIADRDPRVAVREHAQNVGMVNSLNEGLVWAIDRNADMTMTLSADDALAPGALARAAAVFAAEPDVGLVHGKTVIMVGDEKPRPSHARMKGYTVYPGKKWIEQACRAGHNLVLDPEVVVRTKVYADIGHYNTALPHTSDMEMWLRCAARSGTARIRGVTQAYYRHHEAQLSRSFWEGGLGDLQRRRHAFDEFFRQDGHLLRGNTELHRVANRALSRDALRLARRAYDRNKIHMLPADDLVRFAIDCDPAAESSLPAKGLAMRRRLGPSWSRPLRVLELPSLVTALWARVVRRWRKLRST